MIVDLSIPIRQSMPVYPGDPEVVVELADTFEKSGYEGHNLAIGNHAGTHIDAPLHMLQGGADLSTFSIDTFVGQGALVEGFSLGALQAANIQAGDIVLFRSGASERFEDPSYFTEYPVLDMTVVEALIAARVKLVGIDTCSADIEEGFPIHKALLGAGIPIIENLTNLKVLQGKKFRVYALPLSLAVDAAPARVVAEVDNA
jgi:kynurenine formamidase